jgi:hypothetical protein
MTDYEWIWKVEKQEPKRFKEGTKNKPTDDTPQSCFWVVAPVKMIGHARDGLLKHENTSVNS